MPLKIAFLLALRKRDYWFQFPLDLCKGVYVTCAFSLFLLSELKKLKRYIIEQEMTGEIIGFLHFVPNLNADKRKFWS